MPQTEREQTVQLLKNSYTLARDVPARLPSRACVHEPDKPLVLYKPEWLHKTTALFASVAKLGCLKKTY